MKRRRWLVTIDGKETKRMRNWDIVAQNTRMNPEYASFLKEISRI